MSTNERLTTTQEQAIRARLAAATDGPWSVDGPAQCGPGDTLTVYPVEDGGTLAYVQPSWDDAEFIAHAREDIPALLAEVERLRDELAKAREVTDENVERVLHAVKPYVFDRLADMDAEDMAWDATRAALGGGDDA